MKKYSATVLKVTDTFVFLVDNNDGSRSITNDAELVVSDFTKMYPGRRIVYQDTMNEWTELEHDGSGNFLGYKNYNCL